MLKPHKILLTIIVLLNTLLVSCTANRQVSFHLSTDVPVLELNKGSNLEIPISIEAHNGFSDEVRLQITDLPEGLTANFSANPARLESILSLISTAEELSGEVKLEIKGFALDHNDPPLEDSLELTVVMQEPPEKDNEVIIPEKTVVVDEQLESSLLGVTDTQLRFSSDAAAVGDIKAGDVLVGEPGLVAPFGFLRKVTKVKQENNHTTFVTEQASLTDAIEKGSLRAKIELTPEDVVSTESHLPALTTQALINPFMRSFKDEVIFDKDGNNATKNDQVRASGLLELQPILDLNVDIDCCEGFFPPRPYIDTLEFRVGVEQRGELEIIAEFEDDLKKKIDLFTHKFKSFTFYIGPVPVVITPKLTVSLGVDGKLTTKASFEAAEEAELIAGFTYDNADGFNNISDANFDFSKPDADFEGELKTKAYLSAQLDLLLYGAVGPFAEVQASLSIDGKIPRDPKWILKGCFEAFAGINSIDILKDLRYSAKVLESCREIGRAENSPPEVEITRPGGSNRIHLGFGTRLEARGSDDEDGTLSSCCRYIWVSDREGVIGTGASPIFKFAELGQHTITVTIKDKKGATSSDSVVIEVVNTAPRIEIAKPFESTTIFRNQATSLQAIAIDINEPNRKLACDQLVWTSSLATDALLLSGCEHEFTFTTIGTRTLTITATDPQGATAQESVTITVSNPPPNLPPNVRIISPTLEPGFDVNAMLELIGTATDAEGDTPLTYTWTAKLNSAPAIVIGNTSTMTWTPSETFDFKEGRYQLELRLIVTDSQGNEGSDFVKFSFHIID